MARNPSFDEVRHHKVKALSDFPVESPAGLTDEHLTEIENGLAAYFHRAGGTTEFFKKIGPIAAATGNSFQDGKALHVDLSPWPTVRPFSELKDVRNELLKDGVKKLVELLKRSNIKTILVNGFATYTDLCLAFGLLQPKNKRTENDGTKLGEIPHTEIRFDPLAESKMTLVVPSGERDIKLHIWEYFICSDCRNPGSSPDYIKQIEEALRARFARVP